MCVAARWRQRAEPAARRRPPLFAINTRLFFPAPAPNADVFIAPPALDELERRLRGRGTESEEAVATRLAAAKGELAAAAELTWDAYIVNDDLDAAYAALEAALAPSRERANAARAAAKAGAAPAQ